MTQVVATDGRVIGSRATITRVRLLEATAKLLNENSALDLKVIDITREANTSPATFYQYFTDVSDAILDLAYQAGQDSLPMLVHLDQSWDGEAGKEHAVAFTTEFIAHWQAHSSILRLRNLRAEEGDIKFRDLRGEAIKPFMKGLTSKIAAGQADGRISAHINAYATAAAIMAMLERLVAYLPEFNRRGVQPNDMVETLSCLILQILTGEKC